MAPDGQTIPHPPQLLVSERVSTQEDVQFVVPGPHRSAQEPCAHIWSAVHFLSQAPQWLPSEDKETQLPPQFV